MTAGIQVAGTAAATRDLLGMTGDELIAFARASMPAGYGVAARIYTGAFASGRINLDGSPSLSAATREHWRRLVHVGLLAVERVIEEPGECGATAKALLRTHDGHRIECVRIPMRIAPRGHGHDVEPEPESVSEPLRETSPAPASDPDPDLHYTLCLSSQIGCKMGCTFCETGRMGLLRNLTAGEIVAQVVSVAVSLGWKARNLVFMGMGEALDNADNLFQAMRVLSDRRGLHYSQERITVCTAGHAVGIARLQALGWKRLNLSISLNAASDRQRSAIMPVNIKTPLAELQRLLAGYPQRRNFTLGVNYCLMPGLNDGNDDALRIADFCRPLGRVLVNLIPYNPGSAPLTRAPSEDEVMQFIGWLRAAGVAVRRRITKGRSIMAACGQLGDPSKRRVRIPVQAATILPETRQT